jgi:hypothetical protein
METDPPPYRSERAPHGSLPGVETLNCPACWPSVSVAWLAADGSVLGRPCSCSDAEIRTALAAPTEAERRAVAAEARARREGLTEAQRAALDRAYVEGYEDARAGVTDRYAELVKSDPAAFLRRWQRPTGRSVTYGALADGGTP